MNGIEYLKQVRHLTDDTIKTFHLGYCDSQGYVYADSDFDISHLKLDQRFYNTVWFPIFDLYDQLIGISARNLNYKSKDETPKEIKYINTIYSKAHHLFGLNFTKFDCLQARKVYVVEGNVDTLQLWQRGIRNVVGMLGSNLSLTQFCLLSRFVDEVVLVPDGDSAGHKFLQKMMSDRSVLKRYQNLGVSISVVELPDGYDPDKFLQEKSREEFLSLETRLYQTVQEKLQVL